MATMIVIIGLMAVSLLLWYVFLLMKGDEQ